MLEPLQPTSQQEGQLQLPHAILVPLEPLGAQAVGSFTLSNRGNVAFVGTWTA